MLYGIAPVVDGNYTHVSHCSSKRSAITRASDDYYPKNPTTQTLHIAAVAFNSIFLGEVFVADWDMFYVCKAFSQRIFTP